MFFGKKIKNLRKRENQRFKVKSQEQKQKIEGILREVEALTTLNQGGEL